MLDILTVKPLRIKDGEQGVYILDRWSVFDTSVCNTFDYILISRVMAKVAKQQNPYY